MTALKDHNVSEIFALVVLLGRSLGLSEMNKYPGLWDHAIDAQWSLRLNAHREPIDGVPPFHIAFSFNGWPAGLVTVNAGLIAAGEAANEGTLGEALRAAITRAGGDLGELYPTPTV